MATDLTNAPLPDEPANGSFVAHDAALERAERGVAALAAARSDRWYPTFHVASPGGWINDPNGLCFFGGRWHAFYQLHPFGTTWGPMHWGHASSADLAHWRTEPVALAPSLEAERDGVYSGSAVVGDDGVLNVVYTAHRWRDVRDETAGNLEVQCLATSRDGVRFEKRGVVIANPAGLRDFRDPKVWRQGDAWLAVVGRRAADGRGEIALFSSEDLRAWSYEGVVYRHPDPRVFMLECPDLFELAAPDGERRWVLCFSAMGARAHGYRNRNFNNAGYLVGTWRPGATFEPQTDFLPLDWGQNFYAPQTLEAPDGRRILMGWMSPNGGPLPTQQDGWCGQLTVPRELSLAGDGTLRQEPARELETLWGPARELGPIELAANEELEVEKDAGVACVEATLDLAASTAERGGLKLHAAADGGYTYVAYDDQARRVVLDRQAARVGERGYRAAPVPASALATGELRLRVLLDRGSVEVFAGEGEQVLSVYSLPGAGPRAIRLVAEGGALRVSRLVVRRPRA